MRVFFPTYRPRNIGDIERRFAASRIELGEITADPRRFLMLARASMLDHDFAGGLPEKTRALYSQWSGYRDGEKQVHFERALAACGGELIECHTSGHATVDDLVQLVRDLNPSRVIPMHTTAPERFEQFFQNVVRLGDGEVLQIG